MFRCSEFDRFHWQTHGFGTSHANPTADVTLRQVHSNLVFNAQGLKDREFEGDALVTNLSGLSIGVRTADCVPILLLDSKERAVAAVHAGWRGTDSQILLRTIEKMVADFGSNTDHIYAAIGPCIRECCYDVGPEVWSRFIHAEGDGKRHLDLAGANTQQLKSAGVPRDQIFDLSLCTFCQSESFYSYRRQPGDPRRMVSAISILG